MNASGAAELLTPGRRRAIRWTGFVLGIALFGLAVWIAVSQHAPDDRILATVLDAGPGLILAAAALSLFTLAQTAVTFHILTRRHGQVTFAEMAALIASAWLLNYIPMRPGLVGRFVYHRRVNNISMRDSTVVLIWANVLSAVAAGGTIIAVSGLALVLKGDDWLFVTLTIIPLPLIALAAAHARNARPEPDPEVWRLIAAFGMRYFEIIGWAGRYWVCFAIIDHPVSWGAALAIAGVTTLVTMIPLAGNGLGLRELSVGLVAPLLPAGVAVFDADAATAGITADLVNRAIEVILAVPLGLLAAAWLTRRQRRQRRIARSADDLSA